MRKSIPAAAALALGAFPLAALPASAADGTYTANLTQLNDSGVTSTAMATLDGNTLDISIESQGLLAGSPHAQHIHIGGMGQCPSNDDEGSGADGALQVSDAADQYGMIGASLTTEGDTSPDSGLAVDRFPVGDDSYQRSFEVSDDVAAAIEDGTAVVVLHGVDQNGSGEYDGEVMSDLDDSLPEEATNPAACGVLTAGQMTEMPGGGVETGGGSTAGMEEAGLAALGGTLLVGGAGLGLLAARRRTADERS
ncbi:CHRD domain-containing protein [Phycicoccus sp. BSK3Z-2]|uniref:CHRD domain-containing protein n=1 Tax=Phycicoccus avicenniae TaxID=2828860 RepID=A0A941DBY2_9MICO|nr:CHRD domain-containing protein [Phycicoccus avicenniae]MBR7744858.1 CHRD domain-containing protein [Phycicoccus avicenniae]